MSRRIAVVTGARSEFGLLEPLLRLLHDDPRCDLQLIVTGMHLSPRFGHTVDEIRASGLPIAAEVPCLEDGDDGLACARSTAQATSGLATVLDRLRPAALVLLGDRFETLGSALAALLLRIPIIHLHGGESTEGLIDEAARHAVSKMASLHGVAAEPYRARLIAMGEPPDRVHTVGALGLDAIRTLKPTPRDQLLAGLGLTDRPPFALVTFHPVTLQPGAALTQVQALCAALAQAGTVVITAPNADPEHAAILATMRACAAAHGNAAFVASLGRQRYLSALACCDVVVGNSSSGIIEAPSFRVGVVNIGERQRGRLRHANILDCPPASDAIAAALRQAADPAFRAGLAGLESRFGDGHAARRIAALLLDQPLPSIVKVFHDGAGFNAAVAAAGLRT